MDPEMLAALGKSAGGGGMGGGFDPTSFLKTLQGVQMPKGPEAQKVATPHAPTLTPIKGGEFFNLLQALGMPAQTMTSQYRLPSTLEPPTLGFR